MKRYEVRIMAGSFPQDRIVGEFIFRFRARNFKQAWRLSGNTGTPVIWDLWKEQYVN